MTSGCRHLFCQHKTTSKVAKVHYLDEEPLGGNAVRTGPLQAVGAVVAAAAVVGRGEHDDVFHHPQQKTATYI
jgi:hypothetical protein